MAETEAVKETSQGTTGLDPQSVIRSLAAANTIQTAQEALKRINSPELQPSFLDYTIFGQHNRVRKQEERERLTKDLQMMAVDAFNSGQHALLPAFFRPLKEGEATQLLKADQAMRTQAFALPRAEAEPYLSLYRPYQTMQGQLPMAKPPQGALYGAAAAAQAPTTFRSGPEVQGALNKALSDPDTAASMLNAIAAYSGQQRAGMLERQIKTGEEMRQRQQMQPIMNQLEEEMTGQAAPVPGPTAQVQPVAPQAPATTPGTAPGLGPVLAMARSMNVNPVLVQAVLGNEGSTDTSVSPKGALGRFQVMPSTAMSEYGVTPQQLADPQINARTGLRYLADLSTPGGKYYNRTLGKPEAVLAAYFSGPGNVENGRILDPTKSDGNMTVAQYVAAGMTRMAQAEAGGGQVGGIGTQVAGPGAPVPPVAVSGEGLPALPEFKVQFSQGTRFGPKGIESIDPAQAKQRSAESYIDQAMNQDPRLIPQALANAAQKGAIPSPQRMEYYRKVYSTGAFMAALASPDIAGIPEPDARFQAALRTAGEQAKGLFDPTAVAGFRDPVMQEQALIRMRQREQLTGQAEDVATAEARRAGKRTEQERIGTAKGEVAGRTAVGEGGTNRLMDVEPQAAHLYYSKQSGEPIPADAPMPEVRAARGKGDVIKLEQKDADALLKLQQATASLEPLLRTYERIYGPDGAFYKLTPAQRVTNAPATLWKNLTQVDPELTTAQRLMQGWATEVSRILGETGRLSDQDVQRALGILPQLGAFADSAPVAKRLIDALLLSFDRQMGVILRNREFQDRQMFRPRLVAPVNLR